MHRRLFLLPVILFSLMKRITQTGDMIMLCDQCKYVGKKSYLAPGLYRAQDLGKQSVRQVFFLITDSTAVKGYGDMIEKNGKMSFRNASQANFGKGLILRKVSCND